MVDQQQETVDRQKEFSGAGPVRSGFELDNKALTKYMEENVEGFSGTLEIKQFKGGQSNPTYELSAGGKKYALRRKPSGKLLKSAHAVDREYKVISALNQTDVPVAKTYALCTDESVIGSWFYIMDCVEGRIFWTLDNTPVEQRPEIFDAMNDAMAKLHSVDYKAVGLADYGKQGSYFSRQISRWSKQYQASVDEPCIVMDELIAYLTENIPENDETSIVHGDYRIDNMIFHPTEPRILAILDWELSTLGHPLSDFSYSCMAWYLPGGDGGNGVLGLDFETQRIPTEQDYIDAYCRRTGRTSIDNWHYYMAFNFFRLSGITFGIAGRVRDGTASSPQAIATGAMAEPLAEQGMAQVRKI
ncbi:MAG: phosphotransferase family protein [Deltaproteobacteria bacterium]|jgi:aminoglycoside phosphotransferase (APT) family kinase protein|nr:phosphotransferase family protein [Deltaproteobacteria bacterium]MBT4264991.1 phosphotransferase family protein [Deltaproteobacteria bacterium]MBT4643140.1 phosphotransferase family protein [Deltaproteobacteria bacterium]MBT6500616.1 phosphotransferase family protein [Deltaproteobacteria bacterium]MBT6615942.1 phosphotransferase family protein [Deltaproteobacteria bacterium]